jgi:hypothetical protein
MGVSRLFWLKFLASFSLLLILIGLSQFSEVFSNWQFKAVSDWGILFSALAGLLAMSLVSAFVWERNTRGKSLPTWVEAAVAFYIAYSISVYGAAKILKTQFQPPQYIRETPIGELNGFWLTWTYYGYSQPMAYILGWTQVIGCVLLLFRRTRLLGIFVLLPVMINIDLIDHFYNISPLAYYNALHYTFLLLFLLLLDYDKVRAFFFSYQEKVKLNGRMLLLNALRVFVIGFAFWHIAALREGFQPKTKLNGVWQVESLVRNEQTFMPSAAEGLVWSKVYIEWRYGCLFKYHPDRFQKRDLRGQYEIDEQKHRFNVDFADEKGEPSDSIRATYRFLTDSTVIVQGRYNQDKMVLKLKKLV